MSSPPQPNFRRLYFLSGAATLIVIGLLIGTAHLLNLNPSAYFIVIMLGIIIPMIALLLFLTVLRFRSRPPVDSETDHTWAIIYYSSSFGAGRHGVPVDDSEVWKTDSSSPLHRELSKNPQCAICLTEIDVFQTACAKSKCCSNLFHIRCAQDYFNSIKIMKCPLCRCQRIQGFSATVTANRAAANQIASLHV